MLRKTEDVIVDVRTPTGAKVTAKHATVPVGKSLRIVPAFRATAKGQPGVPYDSSIEVTYSPDMARYVITAATFVARQGQEVNAVTMRQAHVVDVLRAATPACVALQLDEDGPWLKASELSTTTDRILSAPLVQALRKSRDMEARMDAVELVYSVAALTGLPPTKAVQQELGIPHRTAQDWISKTRAAGRLEGISFIAGRQPEG